MSFEVLFVSVCSSYRLMQLTGKIAGMDMHVAPNTTMKIMRVKEIMSVVLQGLIINNLLPYMLPNYLSSCVLFM